MVDDEQVAIAAHPLRVHHLPGGYCQHRIAFGGTDEYALPAGRAFLPWCVEQAHKFPAHRQAELAAQPREGAGERAEQRDFFHPREAGARTHLEHPHDLFDQARQSPFVGLQSAQRAPGLANIDGEALQDGAALALLGDDARAILAAFGLDRREPLAPLLGRAAQVLGLRQARAQFAGEARSGAREFGEIVQAPRDVGGMLAGERDLERVRRARGMTRGEQPAERALLARQARLERAVLAREARQRRLRGTALSLQRAQRAVGFRDRALGIAQRVARLAPVGLLLAEPRAQRLDARAQRRQVLLAVRVRGQRRGEDQDGDQRALQARAFPWAETAATRRAISAASPR